MTIGGKATNNRVIFYVDDDRDDLEVFNDVIEDINGGNQLLALDNGDALMRVLQNPPPNPHIIFLDLNMPGKNGFQVLEEIRTKKEFTELPIVVLSTSIDRSSINQSMQLGANYYVPKPNNYDTLKASVNHVLNINWAQFKPNASNFVYQI